MAQDDRLPHDSHSSQADQMNLYQLYDRAAEQTLGTIIAARADAVAIRTFKDVIDDKGTLPGQHPTDFELWYLGKQDTHTGVITPATPPMLVASGIELTVSQLSLTDQANA